MLGDDLLPLLCRFKVNGALMYKIVFALALSTLAHAEDKAPAKTAVYGTFTNEKAAVVPLSSAIATYKEGSNSAIHVEGTVKKVCEKEGCWMTLEDKGEAVRVFFRGHSFFVGRNLEGKKVVTEGIMQKKVQSVADQKHLLEDAGAKKEEIEKIKSPLTIFQFEATAVKTI